EECWRFRKAQVIERKLPPRSRIIFLPEQRTQQLTILDRVMRLRIPGDFIVRRRAPSPRSRLGSPWRAQTGPPATPYACSGPAPTLTTSELSVIRGLPLANRSGARALVVELAVMKTERSAHPFHQALVMGRNDQRNSQRAVQTVKQLVYFIGSVRI